MNRTITSLVALGVGAAAYGMSRNRNNNIIPQKTMRRMSKRIMKAMR